jgi:hypothetical protein
MRKTLKLSALAVVFFTLCSFGWPKKREECRKGELKPNETIHFGEQAKDPKTFRLQSSRRGAYDNSGYHIIIDSLGNITVSSINGCQGNHQNELELMNCYGSITRAVNDTVKIQASTTFRKFYLFNIQKNTLIDSFADNVNIEIFSKTLTGEYCPVIVTGENGSSYIPTGITALPKNLEFKELYKPIHNDESIGIFSSFRLSDSKGQTKNFESNDYVLIGGNSLNVVR